MQTVCFEVATDGGAASSTCAAGLGSPPWDSALPPPSLAAPPILLPRFDPASVPSCARLIQAELQFECDVQGSLAYYNGSTLSGCNTILTSGETFHVAHPVLGPAGLDATLQITQFATLAPGATFTVVLPTTTLFEPDLAQGELPVCITDPVVLASEFLVNGANTTLRIDHAAQIVTNGGCGSGAQVISSVCGAIRARVLYTYCTASAPGASFCAGDGLDPAVTTPCPCGNVGAAGHGCANSANAAGALLDATGCSVTQPDTVALLASGMSGTTPVTFFKGDQSAAGGVPFFDGVRCVDGALVRLATNPSSAGTSSYPLPGQLALSVRGNTPVGSGLTGYYQVSYRNAALAFCPPATANVTNGYSIVW